MFDITQLNTSSFRGVKFYTEESKQSGGQRLTDHTFINGGTSTESNGIAPKTFSIKGYLIGDDYLSQRDALITAFNTIGPGILVDKFYGKLEVELESYEISETKKGFGQAIISMTFKKSENKPIVEDEIVYNVDYRADVQANFENDFENTAGSQINSGIIKNIKTTLKAIKESIDFIVDQANELKGIKDAIGAAIQNIESEILIAQNAFESVIAIADQFAQGYTTTLIGSKEQRQIVNTIKSKVEEASLATATNVAEIQVNESTKIYTLMLSAIMTQEAIKGLSTIEFVTGDGFGELKNDIFFIFDELTKELQVRDETEIYEIEDKIEMLNKLQDARRQFITLYTQRYSRLQSLQIDDVSSSTDVFTYTMEKYNDIKRYDEVMENNNIVDPIFVKGDLRVLPQ